MHARLPTILTLCLIVMTASGCAAFLGLEREPPEENEAPLEEVPEEIHELEQALLGIMHSADLIPVVEGQENEDEEDEDEEGQENDNGEIPELTGGILAPVLMSEGAPGIDGTQTYQHIEEVWSHLESAIMDTLETWDELEPQVSGIVTEEELDAFEDTLDGLLLSIVGRNYLDTLQGANTLTRFLPGFMQPSINHAMAAAYELKYHARRVVLTSGANRYGESQSSMMAMEQLETTVSDGLTERGAGDTAEHLSASLEDLRRAVDKEELELIKANAALVMQHVVRAIEDLNR